MSLSLSLSVASGGSEGKITVSSNFLRKPVSCPPAVVLGSAQEVNEWCMVKRVFIFNCWIKTFQPLPAVGDHLHRDQLSIGDAGA